MVSYSSNNVLRPPGYCSFFLLSLIAAPGHGLLYDIVPSDPQNREEVRCLAGLQDRGDLHCIIIGLNLQAPRNPLHTTIGLVLTLSYFPLNHPIQTSTMCPFSSLLSPNTTHLPKRKRDREEEEFRLFGLKTLRWLSPSPAPLEPILYAWTN